MRHLKLLGVTAVTILAALACSGSQSALASASSTLLCNEHIESLNCVSQTTSVHLVLATGTVLKMVSPIPILCLGELWELTPLGAGNPQDIHILSKTATGCGTGAAHNNCTLTTEELPLADLLKTGLDEGTLELLSGKMRAQCASLGINCLYDLAGVLLSAGSQHFTGTETPVTELGGKFFCPDEGQIEVLLETLTDTYVLESPL